MHWQAYSFVASVKGLAEELFSFSKVVEFGAYNVNFSIKSLFDSPVRYYGIDLIDGANVTVACNAKNVFVGGDFDLAISCECFEHNPDYFETFENMCSHTKPGGAILFTCATVGRAEHGTSRTSPNESPGTSFLKWDYYKNLVEADFDSSFLNEKFDCFRFFINPVSKDLYFLGFTKNNAIDLTKKKHLLDKLELVNTKLNLLAAELEKIWEDRLNVDSLYQTLKEINEISPESITEATFSSYIVKLLEQCDEKLFRLVEDVLDSKIFTDRRNKEVFRQLYFVNRHKKDLSKAFFYAKALFEIEQSAQTIYIILESLSSLGFHDNTLSVMSSWHHLLFDIQNFYLREQVLSFALKGKHDDYKMIDESFIDGFLSGSKSFKKVAFKARYLSRIGDDNRALQLYRSVLEDAKTEQTKWVLEEYNQLKNSMIN